MKCTKSQYSNRDPREQPSDWDEPPPIMPRYVMLWNTVWRLLLCTNSYVPLYVPEYNVFRPSFSLSRGCEGSLTCQVCDPSPTVWFFSFGSLASFLSRTLSSHSCALHLIILALWNSRIGRMSSSSARQFRDFNFSFPPSTLLIPVTIVILPCLRVDRYIAPISVLWLAYVWRIITNYLTKQTNRRVPLLTPAWKCRNRQSKHINR